MYGSIVKDNRVLPGTTWASRSIQLPTAWAPTTLNGISPWTEPGRVRITLRPWSRMVCVELPAMWDAVSRALGYKAKDILEIEEPQRKKLKRLGVFVSAKVG